ncbi:MAG: prepilin-type N-terminal cleavage/methylation domain-containing protein, partial [Candidatus Peregrinibacteria bacterium]|nr:prepilin-type N-terminal cleavage/methylation domain-containing protein [Candidatus Peregrinibacteria bacterium]
MQKTKSNKGFSLLEIMVVVAIVGIMAGSVVVGFNAFGNTIRTRETAGVLSDLLKGFELETIRRDYQKLTIQFEPAYLVVEADAEGTTLPLEWT